MTELDWNKDFALEQAADDAELLAELLEIFKGSSRSDLALIKQGIEGDDAEQVGGAAHSIKGAAASLGINGINYVTKSIEEDCRAGHLDVAKEVFADLESLLDQLEQL